MRTESGIVDCLPPRKARRDGLVGPDFDFRLRDLLLILLEILVG